MSSTSLSGQRPCTIAFMIKLWCGARIPKTERGDSSGGNSNSLSRGNGRMSALAAYYGLRAADIRPAVSATRYGDRHNAGSTDVIHQLLRDGYHEFWGVA